jgi:hypothetical protein
VGIAIPGNDEVLLTFAREGLTFDLVRLGRIEVVVFQNLPADMASSLSRTDLNGRISRV